MSAHVVPLRLYFGIFAALLGFTALTVVAAFQDFGVFNTPVALTIAVVKATLVILYFMHVRYSSRLTWLFVAAGFFWLVILLAFTLADFASRGWLDVYG
jgi:cytochrome c oxidase subunit 4